MIRVKDHDDPEVTAWWSHTESLAAEAFGDESSEQKDLRIAKNEGDWDPDDEMGGFSADRIERNHLTQLESARALLASFIERLEDRIAVLGTQPEPLDKKAEHSNAIFIVHGHDHANRDKLARLLRDWGLGAVILDEEAAKGRTLIEKLEAQRSVGYAFIVLTPDDEGRKRRSSEAVRSRARQNVIFEFGFFIGALGRERICMLYQKDTEIPSDLEGLTYFPFVKDVEEAALKVAKELRAAGFSPRL